MMTNISKHIFILTSFLLVGAIDMSAQFYGGKSDGQAISNILSTVDVSFYCFGGQGEGHALSGNISPINPGFLCKGGGYDGHAIAYSISTISEENYLSGGSGDGLAMVNTVYTISPQIYSNGGSQDGSGFMPAIGTTNGTAIYCLGGTKDGATISYIISTISPLFYSSGGSGDGHTITDAPLFALGHGLWNGYVSSNWNSPGNWTNSDVPDPGYSIVIPGGCLNYPVINTNFSVDDLNWGDIGCKRLDIKNGASLTTLQAVRISGILKIEGQFNHLNPDPLSFTITPGGDLRIRPGGSLLLQP